MIFMNYFRVQRLPVVYLSLFLRHVPNTNPQNIINITCKQMQNFHGQMNVLKGEIERWKKSHYSILFLGSDEERVKKLERVLQDYDIEAVVTSGRRVINRKSTDY